METEFQVIETNSSNKWVRRELRGCARNGEWDHAFALITVDQCYYLSTLPNLQVTHVHKGRIFLNLKKKEFKSWKTPFPKHSCPKKFDRWFTVDELKWMRFCLIHDFQINILAFIHDYLLDRSLDTKQIALSIFNEQIVFPAKVYEFLFIPAQQIVLQAKNHFSNHRSREWNFTHQSE